MMPMLLSRLDWEIEDWSTRLVKTVHSLGMVKRLGSIWLSRKERQNVITYYAYQKVTGLQQSKCQWEINRRKFVYGKELLRKKCEWNEIMRGWKTGEKLFVASSQIQFKKRSRLLFPLSLRESSKREVFIWRASSISSYHIFHSFVARKVVWYLYSFSNSNSFTCFIVTFFCFSSDWKLLDSTIILRCRYIPWCCSPHEWVQKCFLNLKNSRKIEQKKCKFKTEISYLFIEINSIHKHTSNWKCGKSGWLLLVKK